MKQATKKKVKKPKYNGPKTPQKTSDNPLGWKRTNWPDPKQINYLAGQISTIGASGYLPTMSTGTMEPLKAMFRRASG